MRVEPFLHTHLNFAERASDRRRDRGHDNGVEQGYDLLPRQDDDGAPLVRWSELVEPDLTAIHSSGHTPSSSQPASSGSPLSAP